MLLLIQKEKNSNSKYKNMEKRIKDNNKIYNIIGIIMMMNLLNKT